MSDNTANVAVPAEVLDYLGGKSSLTLATASLQGTPHAATLVYVNEGVTIYFSIRPATRTARNISENPVVAFTIDEYNADWSQARGIQGGGECRILRDPAEIRRVHGLFRTKFPFLSGDPSSQLGYFRIQPTEINHIRNQAETQGAAVSLDTEYRRSLVYSIFRELPQREVEALTASLGQMQVQAGQTIVRQGTPGDKFFIIVDGEVEIVKEGAGGSERIASLKQGQFFGEIALLRDQLRTASVRAVTATTLLTMERDTFRNLVAGALATTQDFDRIIRERLRALQGSDQ